MLKIWLKKRFHVIPSSNYIEILLVNAHEMQSKYGRYKKRSIKDQFYIFHGSYFLKNAISFLNKSDQLEFSKFLDGYEYNPYNMFICKNSDILIKFYDEIFPWLFKCESLFGFESCIFCSNV